MSALRISAVILDVLLVATLLPPMLKTSSLLLAAAVALSVVFLVLDVLVLVRHLRSTRSRRHR